MAKAPFRRQSRAATAPPDDRERRGFAESPQDAFEIASLDMGDARVRTILATARTVGLLDLKSARISGRISPALIAQAKRRTGIESDTDLIEFALANIALDDGFSETFRKVRGTVDPGVKLGF